MNRRRLARAFVALGFCCIPACQPNGNASPLVAARSPAPAASTTPPAYADIRLDGIPHVRQRPDFCGEACGEMVLRWQGSPVDQNGVFARSGVDPSLGRGAYTRELQAALGQLGFRTGEGAFPVRVASSAQDLEAQWAALHADLMRRVPSIVCTRFDERSRATEHFRLVVGYSAATDEVLYHDPAIDNGAYLHMTRPRFFSLWPLKYQADTWTVIRLPLEPVQLPATASPESVTSPASLAQHVIELRQKLPAGFTIVVEPPFVVIGDEPPNVVRQRAADTVRWAVVRLKREFFAADPSKILDIWLFKDKRSYDANTRRFFHQSPSTPYGFYSSSHDALIMNISTGGGTLVHEIVHPFIEANFPGCPPWFNEGLGSLYEQCGDKDGRIWGATNWRLASLQEAIRRGVVPSFEELTSMDTTAFYERDRGTNYAQARYLCYYLQEKGILQSFYQQFSRDRVADPTGEQTLRRVLGQPDLAVFKKQWEQFVLGLRFP